MERWMPRYLTAWKGERRVSKRLAGHGAEVEDSDGMERGAVVVADRGIERGVGGGVE